MTEGRRDKELREQLGKLGKLSRTLAEQLDEEEAGRFPTETDLFGPAIEKIRRQRREKDRQPPRDAQDGRKRPERREDRR